MNYVVPLATGSNKEFSVQLRGMNWRFIKGSCDSQPETTTALAFTFSLNLSSLFMEGYSGGIVFGVLSSYVEIMSIFPNQ